jgi:type II secretory pathway component PulF
LWEPRAPFPNTVLAERFLAGAAIVRAGRGLDEAVQATGLMGHDPVQLLVTGQKTGQWLEMLDRVTMFYQDEAARRPTRPAPRKSASGASSRWSRWGTS